jgi:hypothetical protein
MDYSQWSSVYQSFAMAGALNVSVVPERKPMQVGDGVALDQESARQIKGFDDLWKSTSEPSVVKHVFAWRDIFDSLTFGRSLFDLIGEDGRVHNKFFAGGKGARVNYFRDWMEVCPSLASVKIESALWSLVSWLAQHKAPAPKLIELARDFFNVRAPSQEQVRFATALLNGFLLGYQDWPLWEYVGRLARTAADHGQLVEWRKELSRRFASVELLHNDLRSFFYRDVGMNVYDAHRRFDSESYRAFIDAVVNDLLGKVSSLVALEIEGNFGSVTARLEDWTLYEPAKAKAQFPLAKIEARLKDAFPGANFILRE